MPSDDHHKSAISLLNEKNKIFSKNSNAPIAPIKSMTLPGKSSTKACDNTNSSKLSIASTSSKSLASSQSSSTLVSTLNLKDQAFVANIYKFCLPLINIININQDEIEEVWRMHIQTMLNSNKARLSTNKLELANVDNNNSDSSSRKFNPIETFYLFKKLFKEIRHRLDSLLSESYHYLSRDTKLFTRIEKHLVSILDLINTKLECPVVYFDQEWFLQQQEQIIMSPTNSSNSSVLSRLSKSPLQSKNTDSVSLSFIDNHKRILWEIGENYDTFVYIKHDVTESLDAIKKLEKNSTNLNGSAQFEANQKLEKVNNLKIYVLKRGYLEKKTIKIFELKINNYFIFKKLNFSN